MAFMTIYSAKYPHITVKVRTYFICTESSGTILCAVLLWVYQRWKFIWVKHKLCLQESFAVGGVNVNMNISASEHWDFFTFQVMYLDLTNTFVQIFSRRYEVTEKSDSITVTNVWATIFEITALIYINTISNISKLIWFKFIFNFLIWLLESVFSFVRLLINKLLRLRCSIQSAN